MMLRRNLMAFGMGAFALPAIAKAPFAMNVDHTNIYDDFDFDRARLDAEIEEISEQFRNWLCDMRAENGFSKLNVDSDLMLAACEAAENAAIYGPRFDYKSPAHTAFGANSTMHAWELFRECETVTKDILKPHHRGFAAIKAQHPLTQNKEVYTIILR